MMNRVVLVGRLTKDPELRYTPNGVPVASFTLAVNRTFTNQQGEREADFINCVIWRRPAENVANFLKKGSLAGVDGRLQTRSYEGQDGKRVYVTEVMADSVQFLEPRNASGGAPSGGRNDGNYGGPSREQDFPYGNNDQNQRQNNNRNQGYTRVDEDPFANDGQIDISDDDLPF
ncbi:MULTISPECIES: single-stranded DNA-binding protein [Bacillaceae]|jgi:single-strand DNA-binding protein|uniref:Single-stranded DNA-binding protein n=2 Tax=Bacillus infantis TaxID=324767 RepID=U5L4I2_9BACI|nr:MULTISPECIES: single-stranded DNA-binding protein [Bacillus]OXT17780.1 single-stranded DNA-binding protein [Bacillus sp. OG2]AGX02048.1 single-stranded DNA-binding protein [Bacillus infantis NRRL B-14911]MCA1033028.1 single-stranded DNA-binding protein [Bacillus infantis]MCA1042217.1 single-stranded DNA-binding protein [Bacillus infantis]MCK6206402.1 single-stranded DNA-binding protein [Bacillus infantis]